MPRPASSTFYEVLSSIRTEEEFGAEYSIDYDSSDDGEVPLKFHFDNGEDASASDAEKFTRLALPAKALLPLRVLNATNGRIIIQPFRHGSPRDEFGVAAAWYNQADGFLRLQNELQRSAPLFPEMGSVLDHGSPCACYRMEDDMWYRGLVIGYADDDLGAVRVELVDIAMVANVSSCHVKLLPTEYLAVSNISLSKQLRFFNFDIFFPLTVAPEFGLGSSA